MAKKKKNQINLLLKSGMAASISGRITIWVLSSFRIVVIITEIIVMIAFLSRFWLDAQNSDLDEDLNDKVKVLNATKKSEEQFRDYQNRLSIYSEISTQNTSIDKAFSYLSEVVPKDIDISEYNYENETITIEGEASNEKIIQQYLANLQSVDKFENISLLKLETDRNNVSKLIFLISLIYKK